MGSPAPSATLFRLVLACVESSPPVEGRRALDDRLWALHGSLLAFLRYRCDDEDLAEDLLSETYLAFLRNGKSSSSFKDVEGLRRYLVAIAVNKLRDHFRRAGNKPSRRLSFRSREELESWLEGLEDGNSEGAESFLANEDEELRKRLVAAAMGLLPERYREVLRLKFTEDLANPEIADRIGLGIKAVESLIVRAKAAFKKEFEGLAISNEKADDDVDREGGRKP